MTVRIACVTPVKAYRHAHSCNADISIGHLLISQSDIDLLLSQLDILQYLKQTLCLCCLNWTYSNISSRPEPSAVLTGHPPVSQADLTPLLSQLAIFQYLKQTCTSAVSTRHIPVSQADLIPLLSQLATFQYLKQTCISAVSTRHTPISQTDLTSLSRVPRLANAPHASYMLSAYFRGLSLNDDTLLL
jgi:hypothetical protein